MRKGRQTRKHWSYIRMHVQCVLCKHSIQRGCCAKQNDTDWELQLFSWLSLYKHAQCLRGFWNKFVFFIFLLKALNT